MKAPRRHYSRHGLSPLRARIRVRGLSAVDRRTAAARAMLDHRRDLIQDLGGDAAVSAQQRGAVDMAVRTRLLIDHGAAFLLEQESAINKRKKGFIPLVKELQTLVDSYVRILTTLGLERRARPGPTLEDVLAGIAAETEVPATDARETREVQDGSEAAL